MVDLPLARGELPRYVGSRIVGVAESKRAGRADGNTRGREAPADAVKTERALVHVAVGMDEPGVVGARGDARLTARAFVVRDQNDAAFGDEARAGRAVLHAGRRRAVVAPLGPDLGRELRELAADLLDDPVAAE